MSQPLSVSIREHKACLPLQVISPALAPVCEEYRILSTFRQCHGTGRRQVSCPTSHRSCSARQCSSPYQSHGSGGSYSSQHHRTSCGERPLVVFTLRLLLLFRALPSGINVADLISSNQTQSFISDVYSATEYFCPVLKHEGTIYIPHVQGPNVSQSRV